MFRHAGISSPISAGSSSSNRGPIHMASLSLHRFVLHGLISGDQLGRGVLLVHVPQSSGTAFRQTCCARTVGYSFNGRKAWQNSLIGPSSTTSSSAALIFSVRVTSYLPVSDR